MTEKLWRLINQARKAESNLDGSDNKLREYIASQVNLTQHIARINTVLEQSTALRGEI